MKEIHFNIPNSVLAFMCNTLLNVSLNSRISVSRSEMRVDVGEMLHISFTPISELVIPKVKERLQKMGEIHLVFDIETRNADIPQDITSAPPRYEGEYPGCEGRNEPPGH